MVVGQCQGFLTGPRHTKLSACVTLQERFPTSDVPMMIQAALLLRGNKEKSSSLKADEVLAAYAAAGRLSR